MEWGPSWKGAGRRAVTADECPAKMTLLETAGRSLRWLHGLRERFGDDRRRDIHPNDRPRGYGNPMARTTRDARKTRLAATDRSLLPCRSDIHAPDRQAIRATLGVDRAPCALDRAFEHIGDTEGPVR